MIRQPRWAADRLSAADCRDNSAADKEQRRFRQRGGLDAGHLEERLRGCGDDKRVIRLECVEPVRC